MPGEHDLITASALRDWRLPQPTGSKNSRGRVVVVGGSESTPGAAMLAGLAALRVGAGVLTLAVAPACATAVATAVPEAGVQACTEYTDGEGNCSVADVLGGADTVLVGPGIDAPEPATRLLGPALDTDAPLVLDAFALGVLTSTPGHERIAGRSVLTPNSAEAQRLLERDDLDDEDPVAVAAAVAERFGAVVSFQGHVAAPDGRRWTVPTGHPGLGTSGSGDVLAGCVAGLLARGADLAQAACWATYLHATAGDRLAARVSRLGFLARELVDELPHVIVQTEA